MNPDPQINDAENLQSQPAEATSRPATEEAATLASADEEPRAVPADSRDELFLTQDDGGADKDVDAAADQDSGFEQLSLKGSLLEPFGSLENALDFGALVDVVHHDLEEHRLLFLRSADRARLHEFARSLIARHFATQKYYSCYATGTVRRPAPKSIDEILETVIDPPTSTLVVVFDQQSGPASFLHTNQYQFTLAEKLLQRIQASKVRMLVLTSNAKFDTLVGQYDAHRFRPLGRDLPIADAAETTDPPATPRALLAALEEAHGQAGVLSAWAIAWLNEASIDGMVTALESMLSHEHTDAQERQKALAAWRRAWPSILNRLRVTAADDEYVGVKLRPTSEPDLGDLQMQFRFGDRIRHVEALSLLRDSGALRQADVDVLAAFAWTLARLASIEPRPGPFVLAAVVDEWLAGASAERVRFTLVAVFISLVHTGNETLARERRRASLRRAPGRADLPRHHL